MCSQWSSKQRIRLNLPISAFYPHFSVLSPFQRFIPISAFYPHFSVISPFHPFIPTSAFYPHFSFRFQFPFPRFGFSVLSLTRFIPTRFFHRYYGTLHCECDYRKLHALYLQKIGLMFGINCTEIDQSQSNNIFMYTIILVRRSGLIGNRGGLIDDLLYEKGNVLVMID